MTVNDLDEDLILPSQKKVKLNDNDDCITADECRSKEILTQTEHTAVINTAGLDDNETAFILEAITILPFAVRYLGEHNQLASWLLLLRCLAN